MSYKCFLFVPMEGFPQLVLQPTKLSYMLPHFQTLVITMK